MPRRKIGFLKTHKCAGTTVQNILLRYAVKHNLNIVLPEKEAINGLKQSGQWNLNNVNSAYDRIGNPVQRQFSRNLIKNAAWEKGNINYDMFLLHTRWNHREISHVLNDQGKNDVFYFSILRDPVMAYRSYWDYFNLSNQYRKTLEEYAKTVINKYVIYNNMTRRPPGYNQMLTDFGMYFHEMYKRDMSDTDKMMITEEISKKMNEIDQTFDLILIADESLYDEGIVLLKHALCWEYEDIINVKRNTFEDARTNVGSNTLSYLSYESRSIIKSIKYQKFANMANPSDNNICTDFDICNL